MAGFLFVLGFQAELLQDFSRPGDPCFFVDVRQRHRQCDVIQHAEVGNKIETLENEADFLFMVIHEILFLERTHFLSVDGYFA
ncbi:hypothetical protein SDC9_66954 [bioreactor metagenome]|uniref:Uncharacterized protein n=1 Tax=bioreactor metagenome TaxID=1076179 RepID=A0A644Y2Z9_9ZZZZ